MLGFVSWWNEGSGEGVVRPLVTLGFPSKNYYVHYSAIKGALKGERVDLEPDALVLFDVLDDNFARHVTKIEQVPDPKKLVQGEKIVNLLDSLLRIVSSAESSKADIDRVWVRLEYWIDKLLMGDWDGDF